MQMHLEAHQGKTRMKVILKVDWSCERSKKKAIKMVSENKDVQGFAVDEEKKQLTVDGGMDPVSLVRKMRRKFPATEIVFVESEASRALEASRAPSRPQAPSAPPEPNPQVNYNNPYPGYDDYRDYGSGHYPAYGHPNHHNPCIWVPSAPPYWYFNGSYFPQ